jgi:geranylgeranyl diphosphate synthase type II
VRSPEELRVLVEDYLAGIALPDGLGEAIRYTLEGGGKRIRPVLSLAVGEVAGAPSPKVLPAAAAVELVHTFSLVHDDLPALDDDDLRRGRPSAHVRFGEAVAILAGDALLAQAFRLASSYADTAVADELARATLSMIEGQHLDMTGMDEELEDVHELKTAALFEAAAGCALHVAGVSQEGQKAWRAFARDFGLLFQVTDDILDGDGVVKARGPEGARALAADLEARARAALDEIDADTSVLGELVSGLSARAAGR